MQAARGHRRVPRLRTVLLVAMLVPALGAGVLAAVVVSDRWERRQTSMRLADAAVEVGVTIDAVTAVTEEQAHTTVLLVGDTFGLPPDPEDEQALRTARARVDELAASADDHPDVAPAFATLDRLRVAFEEDELGFNELSQSFVDIGDGLVDAWNGSMDELDQASAGIGQPAWLRARLRTLRSSVEALKVATPRVGSNLQVLLGAQDAQFTAELLRSNARFAAAAENVSPLPGSRAEAAWQRFRTDPAAVRMEDHLASSEAVALGTQPLPADIDPELVLDILDAGSGWATLLADNVSAAAIDLEDSAGAQAAADQRSMLLWLAATGLILAASAAAAALLARRLLGPVHDLAATARRVAEGELAVEPVRPRGALELVETVDAFNDMAATLTALEASAIALAEYPDAPRPGMLPGRTGRALQAAVDRLEASVREVDEQRADLAILAAHDDLTGLLNRRAAMDSIERDLARSRRRPDHHLALLFVDLDGLKAINDRYGHAAGDEALRAVATALGDNVREGDVVARMGGDEFVVTTILDRPGEDAVQELADRLLAAVHASHVGTADGPVPLRCSIGVALANGDVDADHLLMRADRALYRAKHDGRGRVAWAADEVT